MGVQACKPALRPPPESLYVAYAAQVGNVSFYFFCLSILIGWTMGVCHTLGSSSSWCKSYLLPEYCAPPFCEPPQGITCDPVLPAALFPPIYSKQLDILKMLNFTVFFFLEYDSRILLERIFVLVSGNLSHRKKKQKTVDPVRPC